MIPNFEGNTSTMDFHVCLVNKSKYFMIVSREIVEFRVFCVYYYHTFVLILEMNMKIYRPETEIHWRIYISKNTDPFR